MMIQRNDQCFWARKTPFPTCKRTLVYDINSTLPQVCNFSNFYNILNTMSMKPRVIKKSEA